MVAIRPMTGGDLDAVSAIYASNTGEPPPKSWRRRVQRLLDEHDPGATALVATDNEAGTPPDDEDPPVVGHVAVQGGEAPKDTADLDSTAGSRARRGPLERSGAQRPERSESRGEASPALPVRGGRTPPGQVVGYLAGEVRSWEFGSETAFWIFGIGVQPAHQRRGIARDLLTRALAHTRETGVNVVRTMVRRDDVPVLTFFRSSGFVAGPYAELELTIEEVQP
jgi:ribosomal protein S18 acetylase RimI-like enzyme